MENIILIPEGPKSNYFADTSSYEKRMWPLSDKFNAKYFSDRYNVERIMDSEQQKRGSDVRYTNKITGESFTTDEKFRSQMYDDFLLEVYSDIERRTLGWGFNTDPKYLQYVRSDASSQEAYMHFIEMSAINAIVKSALEQIEPLIPEIMADEKVYQTHNIWGKPIKFIVQHSNGKAYRGLAIAIPFDDFKDIFKVPFKTYLWSRERQDWFVAKSFNEIYNF